MTKAQSVQSADDYETLARVHLHEPLFAYIAGGSGRDHTLLANRRAFERLHVVPRLAAEPVTDTATAVTLPGLRSPHPVLLAPVAHQSLAHAQGEWATACAAQATDTCLITSTLASRSLESVRELAGSSCWFQLYLQRRPDHTEALVSQACAAGYTALVVTLDATIQLPSARALRSGFRMPSEAAPPNIARLTEPQPPRGYLERWDLTAMSQQLPTWPELERLTRQTDLPVYAKGVLHPSDACRLRDIGFAGVIVSNHGGRTVDGVPASLQRLPVVRAAVGDDYPVLFDSGIRTGGDVFKAIVLGADAVLVGRLQLYALAMAGALGVGNMIRLLRQELDIHLLLSGCASLGRLRHEVELQIDEPLAGDARC